MAKVGGGAAYQRLQPPNEAISNALQNSAALASRRANAEADRNERSKVREQQKKDKLQDSYNQDIATIEPVITGIQSVDEINYRAVGNAQKRIGDIYRELMDNPEPNRKRELNMELANLRSMPKTLKEMEKPMAESYSAFLKGYSEGTISEWDEDKGEEFQAFFGVKGEDGKITPNYIIDFDDKGAMVAKGITESGKYFETSANQILGGHEFSNFTKAINANAYASDLAKGLGKNQQFRISRGFQQVVQDFSMVEDDVRQDIRDSLGTVDDPSDLAKSVWVENYNMNRSKEEFDESSLQEIEDFLVAKVARGYDSTISASQLRKPDGPTDAQKAQDSIELMRNSATGEPLERYIKPNDKNLSTTAFSVGETITTGVGNKDKRINTLYLGDNGEVYFRGEEKVTEEVPVVKYGMATGETEEKTSYQEVVGGGLDSEELNVVANRLGFDNGYKLKQFLKDKKEREIGTQSTEKSKNPNRGILD